MEKAPINHSAEIARTLELAGFKGMKVTVKFNLQITTRAVTAFVSKIEEGHKRAADSTRHFR